MEGPVEANISKEERQEQQSIKNGARIVNEKLLAKGYFQNKPGKLRRLLFSTLDSEDIQSRGSENDRNIINTIFSLLEAQEIATMYKESTLRRMKDKETQIQRLEAQVGRLQRQLDNKDRQIATVHQDTLRLEGKVDALEHANKQLTAKNGDWERQFRDYAGDMERGRRRDQFEMDQLRVKLQERKRRAMFEASAEDDIVAPAKRRRPDSSRELGSLIDENKQLRRDTATDLCFSYKIWDYLRRYNDSLLDLRVGSEPKLPHSFIPTEEELRQFDGNRFDLEKQDRAYLRLLQEITAEQSDDTFKFKKSTPSAAADKEEENEEPTQTMTTTVLRLNTNAANVVPAASLGK